MMLRTPIADPAHLETRPHRLADQPKPLRRAA
jgi:hypothetical protein